MDFFWRSARNCSLSDDSIKSRPIRQQIRNFSSTATCRPFTGDATTRNALSFHSVECLLEELQVRSASCFFASGLDPFFLESILRRPVVLVKDAENARERQLRQFICGELVGDVVAQLVLGGVVPFLFLDQLEAAALTWIGRIEGAGIKFDAFTQTFDSGKTGMIHGALDHLDHVVDLGSMGARDEGGPGADQLFHWIDRHVDRAGGVGLTFEADGRGGRGLLFGQAIDEVVHDKIDHVDVLPSAMIEMVAADGETVTVAAKQKDMEIGPGQADAGSKRNGAAMNEVRPVTVDEIGKTR